MATHSNHQHQQAQYIYNARSPKHSHGRSNSSNVLGIRNDPFSPLDVHSAAHTYALTPPPVPSSASSLHKNTPTTHPDLPPFRPTSSHSRPSAQYYLYPSPSLDDLPVTTRPTTRRSSIAPSFKSFPESTTAMIMSSLEATSTTDLKAPLEMQSPTSPSHGGEKKETGKGWRFYAAFGSLCLVNLVCALDATSLAVALPIIAEKLNGSAIQAFWSGTSFLLTATVFQPTFASLSHVFGRREMLLVALTLFTIGSVIGGAARNFTDLLIGRCIQGTGGGGISALTYIIATDMVSLRERGKWFGLITMMWALGSVTGPIIGGAFAQGPSWRWIFWINMPFCGLSYVTVPLFLRFRRTEGNMLEKFKKVDWLGSFLFIASLTSFLIPITWGGVMYPWDHWRTVVPLVLGALGLLIFMVYSKFLSASPILRGSMFKDPEALVSYFGTTVHGMCLWSMLYYMPLYFEAAKGFSPIKAGVALFPWTFTTAPAAVVVGIVTAKTGKYRWGIWSGWAITTVGVALLMLYEADTSTAKWVCIGLVSGLGIGILYSAMSFAIQASSSNRDLPFAAALYSFFRNFGQMLGVAVGGSIFQNQVKHNLEIYPDLAPQAGALSKDASALVQVIKKMPVSQAATKLKLITAYVDSLRSLWIAMAVLVGCAFILSIVFTKGKSLDRELETEQGFDNGTRTADVEK